MKRHLLTRVAPPILVVVGLIAGVLWLSGLLAGCAPNGNEFTSPIATKDVQAANEQLHTLFKQEASLAETVPIAMSDVVAETDPNLEPCEEDPAIYDMYGTRQDTEWLYSKYGTRIRWLCEKPHDEAEYIFRLTKLQESCGPAVFIVRVENEDGTPVAGKAVVRYWPGAPALPYYDPPASRHTDLGVVGWTSSNGDVGFGVGGGDAYIPFDENGNPTGAEGVTELYIADYDGPSDWLGGIGWLGFTDHCTMFSTFTRIEKEEVVTPTPTTEPTDEPGTLPSGLIEIDKVYIKVVPVETPTP